MIQVYLILAFDTAHLSRKLMTIQIDLPTQKCKSEERDEYAVHPEDQSFLTLQSLLRTRIATFKQTVRLSETVTWLLREFLTAKVRCCRKDAVPFQAR